jgi:hypothetical protein
MYFSLWGAIGQLPDCYSCNCIGERRWEGRPRSNFPMPIASVCYVTPNCEHALFLHECFSDFMFCLSARDGKIEQRVCNKFWAKLSKSTTKTLEMLREAFGVHYLSWTMVFWLPFMFQGWSSVSWRWRTFRATKHQHNARKCWKNLRIHPQRLSSNNPWAHRHRWDQLWSLPEDLNRKFEHATLPRSLFSDSWQMIKSSSM